jgi:hypothetical protein
MVSPPDSALLRLFWQVSSEIQPQELLALSDTALSAMLLKEVSRKLCLSGEEVSCLYTYISSRLGLIRDMATAERLSVLQPHL